MKRYLLLVVFLLNGIWAIGGRVESSVARRVAENWYRHHATQTITVAGGGTSFEVQPGGSATMIAGEKIIYLPGTTVESGGYLHGYIAPQGPWCITPAVPSVAAGSDLPPVKIERTSFNLYPNPTTGRFVVEFSGDIPNDSALLISTTCRAKRS